MENWIKVFEDGQQVRAEIVKGVLTEKGFDAVILNKKESVYQVFGTYEVHVKRGDVLAATNLIKNEISF
ncbi:putative signal transducing protein [Algoriphagus namhaensis]|uniref:Signal transducing protein n=1 Tax=Algoriphagus namhaensis TaxID=915353 RepID=A0ABV8AQ99_9BACT